MTKSSVCLTPYLRKRTSYDCDFWYTCVKWWYLQQIFSFFKILIFAVLGGKRAKNDLKLPISVCFALYLRNCRSYHQDFVNYSGTSLKRTLTGQKFLSALKRRPPWRDLNWKVPKFKVQLFYTGPTLTWTPPPPYLTMGMWNGEKVIFFVMYQFILHQRLK